MNLSLIPKLLSLNSLITAFGYMLFAIGIDDSAKTNESTFTKTDLVISSRWIIFIGTFLLYMLNIESIKQCKQKDEAVIENSNFLILAGSFMIASGAFVDAVGFEVKNLKEAQVY
ncbi:hypothetical protein V6B95_08365 [Thermoanaerobacterium saccharolyticum]|uniref:hypothetical protein n=1 Tax=Thermoanaerobacterium saccharolyticum TaxID=28896 RepID=UPI0005EED740